MQENFTLSDWEGRKAALEPLLAAASREGLVDEARRERLAAFLLSKGVGVVASATQEPARGLATPLSEDRAQPIEESEMPRFVRGFHDILITIGIMVGLGGLWGLGSVYFVLPAVLVLAEILVRRQRLALPAFVLTGWFALASGFATATLIIDVNGTDLSGWQLVLVWFAIAALMAVFYWRYQVPVALAANLVSTAGFVITVILSLLTTGTDYDVFFTAHPGLGSLLLGLFAAIVFGLALFFDFADPSRTTRRSDVAFWLHLVAAPAVLYTAISLIFLHSADGWFGQSTTTAQTGLVLASVVVLMLIGILMDRRAFVTSGLISLGYVVYTILEASKFEALVSSYDRMFYAVMLAIGVIVLTLGIGWQTGRRWLIGLLPASLSGKLPAVRA